MRVEEVKFFDSKHQQEQEIDSVVNADKHVFYRNIYIFVNRLKDLAVSYNVKRVITAYLRGSALI